ncbi:MAG TPA: zinc metallopeptidase [Chloroflexus aurantiacus]|jgi:Zn-dependent membrane protease YugP|uniref:Peptidase membrane zinc metallopeptidase putative n=1 Tax=Chloroflexus aurantiacus (strain ATCC 29366 / DSM 635 / J-10-fl) TaxID=324602 RepID=A9WCC6_CHLAA|nr:zinc metallopeptidase [Chloroflexus aurantiacus]ABY34917.1 peptidase membrane zinc metallopeptidase putative [Chloroflexus aurantiacus J-10-fl]RMG45799.1 MAG: zinc metallopeptidase [Chloroflexota bacterium]HBW69052.1 zinc metallopeptidase [Chloroflexus aurantiacus]
MPFFFDPTYLIFAVPAMLFALWAQFQVQSAFNKWSQVANMRRLNGFDVARVLMRNEGLDHVGVETIPGMLTDHYDPSSKVIRLSQGSLQPSVAAMAIVAHELGHAAQDKEGYAWLRVRSGIVGFANIGSQLGTWLFFIGMLLSAAGGRGFGFQLAVVGVILFSAAVAFTLVTLPVEFNASARAREMLQRAGLVTVQEAEGVNAVLNAAALTYVAAAAQAIAQLLYFVTVLMRRRE